MRTYTATTVTVGSGRSIHWGSDCGTFCGAAHRNGFFTEPKKVSAETATCKRCIKIMVVQVAEAHVIALAEQERTEAHGEALTEQAQRTDDAERAAALAAPSDAYPAAIALDTWLTAGLVLVGPATDSLFTFQSWDGGTAVLLHLDTQQAVRVAQADIINWRYLPGADAATLAEEARTLATPEAHASRYHAGTSCVQGDACPFPHADRVQEGDVIQFMAGGGRWTVRTVEYHAGTDLYSFGVHHSLRQFVRHATEQVHRVVTLEATAPAPR